MSARQILTRRPPVRVLTLHALRAASLGPANRSQLRKMAQDADERVRKVSEVLAAKRPSALSGRVCEIEMHRAKIASGQSPSQSGHTAQRMEALANVASKSRRWAALILDLVVALRPIRVLEMGTAVGISGAYIAAGLEANGRGELVTVEANKKSMAIADDTFRQLGLDGRVTTVRDTFEAALESLMHSDPKFDLVFKDGEHSESATISWFDSLVPKMESMSAFLLDDIRRDAGMKAAWDEVRQRSGVAASIDFFGLGLVFLSPESSGPTRSYRYGIR